MENLISEAGILEEKGDFQGALKKYVNIENVSRESGDKKRLETSLRCQGWILLHKLDDIDAALKKYMESEKLCRELKNKSNLKLCLHDQAYILARKGERNQALRKYREFKEENKTDAMFERFMSEMNKEEKKKEEQKMHKAGRTIFDFKELEMLDKIIEETETQSSILFANGLSQYGEGNYNEAINLFENYVKLNYEIGDKKKVMGGLHNIGVFILKLDLFEDAQKMFQMEEGYCRELGDKEGLHKCLQNQSSILRNKLNKYEDALKKYTEDEVLCREMGDTKSLAVSLQNQAWILMEKTGDYETAFNKFRELENLLRESGDEENLKISLQSQISILKAWGDKKAAKAKKKELKSLLSG